MKLFKAILGAAAVLSCAQGASAQTAPAATPAPAAEAAPAAAGTFTDDQVQKYATAMVAVNKVQLDATIPAADKQAKMGAIVQASGVDIPTFNAMTQASQTDKALQTRIQTAAAAVAAHPAG